MLMRVVIIREMLAIHILHTSWAFLLTHAYCGASILRHCHTNNRSNRLSQSWARFPKEDAKQMHLSHYLNISRAFHPLPFHDYASSMPYDCVTCVRCIYTPSMDINDLCVRHGFIFKLEVWKSWTHSNWASLFRFSGFHVLYRVSLWSPP